MNSERPLRGKRNSFVINLIETAQGFSIVQGIEQLNKPQGIAPVPSHAHPTLVSQTLPSAPPSKELKSVFRKTNLIFHYCPDKSATRPSSFEHLQDQVENVSMIPEFQADKVQKQEQKQVAKWYSQRHRIPEEEVLEKDEFKQWIQNYHKHRNYVLALYNKDYLPEHKYLSASTLRKHLVCEAFWVMKLHHFLSSQGLINAHSASLPSDTPHRRHIFKPAAKGNKQELLAFQLSTGLQTVEEENENQLLKRLTAELRPYCDYCRIHCGLVWFQHNRSLDSKQIVNIMKNVNSKNPPLSQKQYEYVLCVRCYCENHFPLLLTHHDFKKVTLNDKLEPNRRKKSKKRRRHKRRDGEQEQQEEPKDNLEEEKSNQQEEDEAKKKEELSATIKKLLETQQQKVWSLQQTAYLLELIEKHQDDWLKIHQLMKKRGFCRNIQTEEVIIYFLSLPTRGFSRLQEEYSDDEFIESNLETFTTYTSSQRLAEKKLEDAILLAKSMEKQMQEAKKGLVQDKEWKIKMRELMRLEVRSLQQKIDYISACEEVARQINQE